MEEFLRECGVVYERRDYFRQRFSTQELADLFEKLDARPVEFLSRRSTAYRTRPDEIDALSDEALIAAMIEEPTLLRRPLVVGGDQHALGFDRRRLEEMTT